MEVRGGYFLMKLAACIIAKNEEENLPRLLKSLVGKFDEIVLVDTGSEDRTPQIAKEFGCKVVAHEWRGFADARNRAISELSSDVDWIWHFDADFELEDEEYRKALVYLRNLDPRIDGAAIGVRNLDNLGNIKGVSSHIFVHRPRNYIKWKGRVHEYPTVKLATGIPIFVNHYGYSTAEIVRSKAERNLKILLNEMVEFEKGSREYLIKLFYIIQSYTILSYQEPRFISEALKWAEEFLEGSKNTDLAFFSTYVYNYILSLLERTRDEEKLEQYIEQALSFDRFVPDIYITAIRYYMKKDKEKAIKILVKLISLLAKWEFYPFFSSTTFASDRIRELIGFFLSLKTSDLESISTKLEKIWRKTGSKFAGALLLRALSGKDKVRLWKKLVYRFGDDDFLLPFLFFEANSLEGDVLRLISNRIKGTLLFFLVEALIKEKEGKKEEALELYSAFLKRKKEPFITLYIASKLSDVGINFRTKLPIIGNEEENTLRR